MKNYQERNPSHVFIKANELAPKTYLTDDAVAYLTNIKSDGKSFTNDYSIYQIDPDYIEAVFAEHDGERPPMDKDFVWKMGHIGDDGVRDWKPEYLKTRMRKVVDVKTNEGRKGMSMLFTNDLFDILNTHTFLNEDGEDIYEDIVCNFIMIEKVRGEDDEPSLRRAFTSLSVGNIIVNNNTGKAKVVANWGFNDIEINQSSKYSS